MKLAKKNILLISAPVALIAIVLIYFVVLDSSRQKHIEYEADNSVDEEAPVGAFPLYNELSEVEFAPGIRFKISSTTSLSTLNRATIERLKNSGFRVDSSSTLLVGRTLKYGVKIYTKTYSVDLPLATYTFETDTTTGHRLPHIDVLAPKRYIRNLEFVEAHPNDPNSIGVDLLSLFAVEYNLADTSLTLHRSMPAGYEKVGELFVGHGVKDMIGTGSRFYLDMRVDHENHTFLVNTALRDVPVKMPIETMTLSNRNTGNERIINNTNEELDAFVDRDAWCEYGQRAGGRKIYYYNDNSDVFEINPIAFFGQDMVIDFKHGDVGLRDTYDMVFSKLK